MLKVEAGSQLRPKTLETIKLIEKKVGFVLDISIILAICGLILNAIMAAYDCQDKPWKTMFVKARLKRMIKEAVPEISASVILAAMKTVGEPLSREEVKGLYAEARVANAAKLCAQITENK